LRTRAVKTRRELAMGRKTEGQETMTDAAGGGRAEIEQRLVGRSIENEDFRRRLLEDPKTILEELGTPLPEAVRIVAVEETADTIYLVLPSASPVGDEGGELSERELEAVAGAGETWVGITCGTCYPGSGSC
jgi:hypothetical protein